MVHVISKIERVDPHVVHDFRTLSAALVHEAAGRIGAVDPAIKPIVRGMRVCGPACTVRAPGGDNLMMHRAIYVAAPGDVLVVDNQAVSFGPWGEITTTAAMHRGIAGLVIDGFVRDTREIAELGFPAFARGACIRGTVKESLGTVNHPIVVGGVHVAPGDLVLGDDDGVVVIPREQAREVLARARDKATAEARVIEHLRAGKTTLEVLGFDAVLRAKGIVEE